MKRSKVSGNPLKKFDNIQKQIKDFGQKVEEIANESAQVARNIIIVEGKAPTSDDSDFTQKHGEALANYIESCSVSPSSFKWEIVAGADADEEIRYELFYANYGAGIMASSISRSVSSGYVPHATQKNGFWYYKLDDGAVYYRTGGANAGKTAKSGRTNRSVPLLYMQQARNYAKSELGRKANLLKTSIRRNWGNIGEDE